MNIRIIILIIPVIAFLQGCQSNNLDDFREKGRAKTKSLLVELKKIRTKDQLILREPFLKKAFTDYAPLLQEIKQFVSKHPEIDPYPLSALDQELSDRVKLELLRISRLEGGEEILLRCQNELLKDNRSELS